MKKRIEYQYGANGEYVGEKENIITDRDPDFITLPFCTMQKPKSKSGYIAVISLDKVTWNYVPDISGLWYHKENKSELILSKSDYKHDVSDYTKKEPLCAEEYCIYDSKSDSWIISESKKEDHDKELQRCSIIQELNEIDAASMRALRAVLSASTIGENPSEEDVKLLSDYEAKAKKLREQYNELQK